MANEDARGRFVWYELITSDTEKAKVFYSRLIGWGLETIQLGSLPYTMLVGKHGPLGVIVALSAEARAQGVRPHWLAYVSTPSVDETVRRACEQGANVLVAPMDIPGTGRFAVLADPQGATFGTFTSASDAPPPEEPPGATEITWHELMTSDPEAAFRFYSGLFHWEKTYVVNMGREGFYSMYGVGGQTLGGMVKKRSDVRASSWLLYIGVADIQHSTERAEALGANVITDPMEVIGGGWMVQCIDPQGAPFAMFAEGMKP